MPEGLVGWAAYQMTSVVQATAQLARKPALPRIRGIRETIDTSARLLESTGSNWSKVAVAVLAIVPVRFTRTVQVSQRPSMSFPARQSCS